MAGDPVSGFGERIAVRARLPCTTIVFIPFLILMAGSFFSLVAGGTTPFDAFNKVREVSSTVLAPLVVVPVVTFALLRELYLHELLEKYVGTRDEVKARIAELMSELAKESGYEHSQRIKDRPSDAMNWFYFHVNQASVTRYRAFEVWEGLYVNLYISLACLVSLAMCLYLAWASDLGWIWVSSLFPATLFVGFCAVRRQLIIPRILKIPVQQVRDIERGEEILTQAIQRFGA